MTVHTGHIAASPLSAKLRHIVAMHEDRATTRGEKDNARRIGEGLAARDGLTFDEAIAAFRADQTGSAAKAAEQARPWQERFREDLARAVAEGIAKARAEAGIRAEAAAMDSLFTRWRTTDDDDERDTLRAQIEAAAKRNGKTFKQAFDDDDGKRLSSRSSFFDGLEDAIEANQPGHKRRRRQEEDAKAAASARRRAAVLARYGGSEEAAFAPCEGEQMLIDALAHWRKVRPECPRWTDSVDGWADWYEKPPAHIDAAIRAAIPLPTTLDEAEAEWKYWRERDEDLCALVGDMIGDYQLDGIVIARMRIIEKMIEFELPARTISDVAVRVRLLRHREGSEDKDVTRIFDDIFALAATSSGPPVQRGQIADQIRANPGRTDRSIARELRCSPTTVGKVRGELDLKSTTRTVQRGGQIYEASYTSRGYRNSLSDGA